jgi:hypothetical protein
MTPGELWWWVQAQQDAQTFGKKHPISRAEVQHMYERAGYGQAGD